MSQLSTASSFKTSTGEETMYVLPCRAQSENIYLGKAITIVPLSTTYNANLGSKESQTTHATSSGGPSVGNFSNPSLDKFREDNRYVDRVIRYLVTRVLREDIHVAGISRPLAQIVPSTNNDEEEQTTDSSKSNDSDNNLHKFSDSVLNSTGVREKSPKPNKKQVVFGTVKSWSKVSVSSKKRKITIETESDDVEGDVQDIIRVKKTVSKQSSVKVPNAPMDNISFHSVDSADKWRFVYQRRIALERELGQDALKIKEIMDLISAAGLIKTVTDFGKFYEVLVKEFVVNIPVDCAVPGSQNFRKVYVRGKIVHFSPAVINRHLGRSKDEGCDLEVTDNQVFKEIIANQVAAWPMRGKLSAGQLNLKYAILHKIGAVNWVPTNHTSTVVVGLGKFLYDVGTKTNFDYGTYIFDQTVRHAATNATKMPIAFPSLICGVVLNQHPGILLSTDGTCKHVVDLVLTSAEKKTSTTADTILVLKETCKDLDEIIATSTKRKLDIERLIKSLEQPDENGTSKAPGGAADTQESDDHVEGHTLDNTTTEGDDSSSSSSSDEED
ncbi:uncharacterized protein LOC131619279 [Vicia villosa]|uniref:uncharacterized protein LOC131619279 n=1 Tax=Vicia villosa TaxID=3911 RepID=UPI00273C53DB|nr:uncharacterized protein LOC131619279 [Vicia villosa]